MPSQLEDILSEMLFPRSLLRLMWSFLENEPCALEIVLSDVVQHIVSYIPFTSNWLKHGSKLLNSYWYFVK